METVVKAEKKIALRLKDIKEFMETQKGVTISKAIEKVENFWYVSFELSDGRTIELKKSRGKLTLKGDDGVRFKTLDEFTTYYKAFKKQQ